MSDKSVAREKSEKTFDRIFFKVNYGDITFAITLIIPQMINMYVSVLI